IHFADDIDISPNGRFDEQLGFVDAKLFVGERTLASGIEERDAAFAADVELAEFGGQPGFFGSRFRDRWGLRLAALYFADLAIEFVDDCLLLFQVLLQLPQLALD